MAHRIADGIRSVISYLTPAPVQSHFVSAGTLTPSEFVEAGDQLVFKFPTWEWQTADRKRRMPWLPEEKQFLITRGVPSRRRVADLNCSLISQKDEDWFVAGGSDSPPTTTYAVLQPLQTEEAGMASSGISENLTEVGNKKSTAEGAGDENKSTPSTKPRRESDSQQPTLPFCQNTADTGAAGSVYPTTADGFIDLSDYQHIDRQVFMEDSRIEQMPAPESAPFLSGTSTTEAGANASGSRGRFYDLSITYDKYYQTPRLWLFGYDMDGIPLTSEKIVEDILSDYMSKTITIDPHPCTGVPTVSIHPCKHSHVMKKVVAGWIDAKLEPRHDLALFVLLKFIASAIPTIEYDFTMDILMPPPSPD